MASASAIPLPLQKAIDFLPIFIECLVRARRGLIRCMRVERREAMVKFLKVILLSTSLQHDGAVVYLNDRWAKPKTLQELAEEAGLSYAQAKRCLALLKELEFITSKQIKRKNKLTGQLEVSPALRCLTRKFWQKIGLWDLYKQSVAWAKKHVKRALYIPFKALTFIEKTAKTAGNIVNDLLNIMQIAAKQEKDANRNWREKMRTCFKQTE